MASYQTNETLRVAPATTAWRKLALGLKSSRTRWEEQAFVAEGWRCLSELMRHFRCRGLMVTQEWLEENSQLLDSLGPQTLLLAKAGDMTRISSMQTPQGILGIFDMPQPKGGSDEEFRVGKDELVVALDRVQDPGNLGTIVRTADWFGVERIWASADTADVFNPKVVQSTMGALARVRVSYTEGLGDVLKRCNAPVYGTFLDGEDIYQADMGDFGVLVMGNEGAGISQEVAEAVTRRLRIPSYPPGRQSVESLNVGVATGVCLAEFRRKK